MAGSPSALSRLEAQLFSKVLSANKFREMRQEVARKAESIRHCSN